MLIQNRYDNTVCLCGSQLEKFLLRGSFPCLWMAGLVQKTRISSAVLRRSYVCFALTHQDHLLCPCLWKFTRLHDYRCSCTQCSHDDRCLPSDTFSVTQHKECVYVTHCWWNRTQHEVCIRFCFVLLWKYHQLWQINVINWPIFFRVLHRDWGSHKIVSVPVLQGWL